MKFNILLSGSRQRQVTSVTWFLRHVRSLTSLAPFQFNVMQLFGWFHIRMTIFEKVCIPNKTK